MALLLPALLLALPAHAQDAARADPPLPIAGEPWSASVQAYALPPQDVSWLTEDVPQLRCAISVALQPDASFVASPGACPDRMGAAALAATQSWVFLAPAGATGTSHLRVDYVFQYSATLGTTTLHAEIDPGAEHTEEQGVPGIQLVHRAASKGQLEEKLPKAARKAGLGATTCVLHVSVDAVGHGSGARVVTCPATLAADATAQAQRAKYLPLMIDGVPYSDDVDVKVSYAP